MAWESVSDNFGQPWMLDWEGVIRIVRAMARSEALLMHAKINEEQHAFGFGPNIVSYEVNWPSVHNEAESIADVLLKQYQTENFDRLYKDLIQLRDQTAENEQYAHDQNSDATRRTMDNVASSIAWAQGGEATARVMRDLSADIVVAGATVATGGAAGAAILGGGSLMKGAFKYQDTGSVGQALLETTATVVTGSLDLGVLDDAKKAMSAGQKLVFKCVAVKLDAELEAAKTLAEGGTLKEAGIAALAKVGNAAIGETATGVMAKLGPKLAKAAAPIFSRIHVRGAARHDSEFYKQGVAAVRGGIKAYREDSRVDWAKKHWAGEAETHETPHARRGAFAAESARTTLEVSPNIAGVAYALHSLGAGPDSSESYVRATALKKGMVPATALLSRFQ